MQITVDHATYIYSPQTPFAKKAVDDVSLEIDKGEFVGLIGHTGCGKSTLIQMLSGLVMPNSGRILINGEDINDREYDTKKLRRTLGVVFQYPEYQLFEETVRRDVSYGPIKAGYNEKEINECVSWAMQQVGLDEDKIGEKSPFELSGGQKRKVAIAGVLALKPEILILDEPVAGLDPAGRNEFMNFVSSLNRAGITIVMISHNMDGLCENAGRIIVMKKHKIIRDASPAEVFSDVEFLKENRLGTSEARDIVELLRQKGFDVPRDIITHRQLVDYIAGRAGR